eukprot:TRINITY_DN19074_c0_g1_i1.p1 TRINITY_DN19074_c0_g1~~TRINITY_DN19074_c0_g1_i1.p1  ORF type:complete len:305 (+),score=31.34 TRINITY_DN19074_c0_g1_i1:1228-2142(+)
MQGRLDFGKYGLDFGRFLGKPVLFRGAAKKMPAYKKYTDEYLADKLGHIELDRIESEKEETRLKLPSEDFTMKEFISRYKTENIYCASSIGKELGQDLYILPVLNCGGSYTNRMSQSVMWMSSGSTKSVVHQDTNHNIHCLLDGKKEWALWPPSDPIKTKEFGWISGEELQKEGKEYKHAYGQYIDPRIDLHDINITRYPGWDKVRRWSMVMEPGDCAFVPYGWFHFVEGAPQRGVSFHVWFSYNNQDFNATQCKKFAEKGVKETDYLLSIGDCTFGWEGHEPKRKRTTCKYKRRKLAKNSDEL